MASSEGLSPRRWHSMTEPPLNFSVSEVRIVLLGADALLTSKVANFILGRSAFETKVPLPLEQLYSEKARGLVEGRTITIINTPHLYNPQLSQEELTRRIKECISLADPGPHVVLLVLQSQLVPDEIQDRVRNIFETYSPLCRKRWIMLSTVKEHGFISACEVRNHQLVNISKFDEHEVLQLLRIVDAVVKETEGSDLQEEKHSDTRRRNQHHVTEIPPNTADDTGPEKITENTVSDLRIILLGKSAQDTGGVGNIILGRSVFETEDPPHSTECEKVRGHVKGRHITIINAPHLFDQHLTHHQLTLQIKKCVSLSAPGPHVIILVVQPDRFTETDKARVNYIFSALSDEIHKYTMVLTTQNMEMGTSVDPVEKVVQKIIAEGKYRHLEFSGCSQAELLEKMELMVQENKGSLNCEMFEDAELGQQPLEQIQDPQEHLEKVTENIPRKTGIKQKISKFFSSKESRETQHLNVVLLGKKKWSSGFKKTPDSGFSVKQEEVSGHQITQVKLPALYRTQLSEREVLRQTFQCVSTCDPGVHAFCIIVPKVPLTDEHKTEIETFQRIFGSAVNDHTIFIISQQSPQQELDEDLQAVIKTCGGRYRFCSSEIKDLFPFVKELVLKNSNGHYTMAMYAEAQSEAQLKYRQENQTLQQQVTELKRNATKTQDLSNDPETLRIVLLGKTGVGKSASGNNILGKDVFEEMASATSVTTMCQKETAEIRGRRITVIDTPGLFDTETDNKEISKEIVKCISMAAPGPHVFLLVLSIGRFTQEEEEAVKIIQKTFGETVNMFTIVLFTRGDDLKGRPMVQYIEKAGKRLKTLLFSCGNRYQVFNNSGTSSHTQVPELLGKIDSMVKANTGSCFTNEIFQEVEKALEEKKERILKEREEQIEREKEELKTKHEADIEEMRREMQNLKERQAAEQSEKEKQFKQREELIKREKAEMEEKLREDFEKRSEEDDLKMKQWMQQINSEREQNTKRWERQREDDQKRRDQEERDRRRREEEWKEHQREETQRFKKEKEEMEKFKQEELGKLQKIYEQKAKEEDRKIKDLEEQMKYAEESKRKELQDLMLSKQRETEQIMLEEEKKKKEQQKVWEKKIAVIEKRNLEQIRKEKQFEWERQKEEKERELKETERKEKEEQEKRRIEDEANKKIKMIEEQLKIQREKDEEERKIKDMEHKQEMEEKLQKQQEEFRKEKEDEKRKHDEEKERNLAYIQEQHKREMEKLKKQTEGEAREQAEKEFSVELEKKVKEAKEEVESERTIPGRAVDWFINGLYKQKNE